MPPADPDLVAGRYAVRDVLAVGGMSTVHLAEDVTAGRDVALKMFRTSGDPLAAERLQREGALLARLEHPHLVRGYDAGADEDGSNAWLALELIPGPNLAVALHRGGPLPPAEARRLLEHVAGALAYIHTLGVVHRDVKPSNVLLTADPRAEPTWQAKLADFGIATEVQADRVLAGDAPVGTAAYFSPEQTLGQPVTTASDIYSLGLVALEALTGERAFPGGAIESAQARLFRQPSLPEWLDEGWRALLETMTARDPRSRPSAGQVRAACRSLAGELLTAPATARADYDPDVRTEPATLLAPALFAVTGSDTVVPAIRRGRWARLRPRPAASFADRFSRRALVVSSAGVLVLGTAAGGAALVAAAPTTPIPLEQALPAAPPAVADDAKPTPTPETAATPKPRAAPHAERSTASAHPAAVVVRSAAPRPHAGHAAASAKHGARTHGPVKHPVHAHGKHGHGKHATGKHATPKKHAKPAAHASGGHAKAGHKGKAHGHGKRH